MAGKDDSNQRRAATLQLQRNRLAFFKNEKAAAQFPLIFIRPVDKAVSNNALKLSGHRGNVLLEELKPGQRVLLNASCFLDQPFMFEPVVSKAQNVLHELTSECKHDKEMLFALYSQVDREVRAVQPRQLHSMTKESYTPIKDFMTRCVILAVVRQLCFDEPVPLIDIASVTNLAQGKQGDQSDTKARKIGTGAGSSSGNRQADAVSTRCKSMSCETETESDGDQSIPPCICSEGKDMVVLAFFPDDLRYPNRLEMPLDSILNVQGHLVTTEAFLMKSVDIFEKRLSTEKPALQQEYRTSYQVCHTFIRQEGNGRSDDEWRQFITNCVHLHALRHVLHGKPLLGARNAERDHVLDNVFHRLDTLAVCREKQQSDPKLNTAHDSQDGTGLKGGPAGEVAMTFADIEKMDWVTVYVDDCVGFECRAITGGATLQGMRERAESMCQLDVAAAKLYFNELTKSCRIEFEHYSKLRDMVKIGIPKAVDEMQTWMFDSLYWCVLRKTLHNVPLRISRGHCAAPDEGTELPSVDGDINVLCWDSNSCTGIS